MGEGVTIYISRRRSAGKRYPLKIRQKAICLRKKGNTISSIHRALGPDAPSHKTLRKWFKQAGLQATGRKFDRKAALEDLKTMNPADVAKKYKCTERWILMLKMGKISV